MELEDEADIPVAESRQFLIAQSSCLRAIDNQSPAIRCVERADDLQQGCLTRPLGPTIATTSPLFIVRSMPSILVRHRNFSLFLRFVSYQVS